MTLHVKDRDKVKEPYRPGPLPHPDPDLVLYQEPQHRVHGAQLIEQPEHQPDGRLDLLIGVQGRLAGEGRRAYPAGSGTASSPRPALASRPEAIRCLIRCSSSSVIVPFSPSRRRSLYQFGS